jgi:hypothetical protein
MYYKDKRRLQRVNSKYNTMHLRVTAQKKPDIITVILRD